MEAIMSEAKAFVKASHERDMQDVTDLQITNYLTTYVTSLKNFFLLKIHLITYFLLNRLTNYLTTYATYPASKFYSSLKST